MEWVGELRQDFTHCLHVFHVMMIYFDMSEEGGCAG